MSATNIGLLFFLKEKKMQNVLKRKKLFGVLRSRSTNFLFPFWKPLWKDVTNLCIVRIVIKHHISFAPHLLHIILISIDIVIND